MLLLVDTEKHLQIFKEPLLDTLDHIQMIFPAHLTHVEHDKTKKINKSALLELLRGNLSQFCILIHTIRTICFTEKNFDYEMGAFNN